MCTPMCSRLSTKSLTSPPAQNARPAPVTTMQRTAESSSTSSEAWKRSRPRPRLSALNASGRLSVMVATPSWRVRVRNLKSMSDLSLPRTAGPQPRDVLRLALLRSSPRTAGPSPATCCGSYYSEARLARRCPSPATCCGSYYELRASLGAAAGCARHGTQDVGDLERFHQDHVHALSLAVLGRQLDAEAGDEDHRHRRRDLLDGLGHLPARDARHRQIGEHHVVGLGAELRDRFGAVGEDGDPMPAGLKHIRARGPPPP